MHDSDEVEVDLAPASHAFGEPVLMHRHCSPLTAHR